MRSLFLVLSFLTLLSAQAAPAQKVAAGDPNALQGGTLTYEAYEPDTINPITYKQVGATEILS